MKTHNHLKCTAFVGPLWELRRVIITKVSEWKPSDKVIVQLHDFIPSVQSKFCKNVNSLKEDTTFAHNYVGTYHND